MRSMTFDLLLAVGELGLVLICMTSGNQNDIGILDCDKWLYGHNNRNKDDHNELRHNEIVQDQPRVDDENPRENKDLDDMDYDEGNLHIEIGEKFGGSRDDEPWRRHGQPAASSRIFLP